MSTKAKIQHILSCNIFPFPYFPGFRNMVFHHIRRLEIWSTSYWKVSNISTVKESCIAISNFRILWYDMTNLTMFNWSLLTWVSLSISILKHFCIVAVVLRDTSLRKFWDPTIHNPIYTTKAAISSPLESSFIFCNSFHDVDFFINRYLKAKITDKS